MKIFYFKGLKVKYWTSSFSSSKAIILCPGLPASSIKNDKGISMLLKKNFHVFYILYPGYPDSSNTAFLSKNPANLISELITFLRMNGIQNILLDTFFLVGSSFGGSVVLDVKNADKIVAISPIIDYKSLYKGSPDYNYKTFKDYLTKEGYKISPVGWERLKKGKLFNFFDEILKEKALVVYNKNDKEINPAILSKFISSKRVESISIYSDRHLSFKNLPPPILVKITKWLEKPDIVSQYNQKANNAFEKIISKIEDGQSAFVVTGSLGSANLIPESDIDFYVISGRSDLNMSFRVGKKEIEWGLLNFDDFSNYVSGNIRGMSKLFNSKIITSNQNLRDKIQGLRKLLVKKYGGIFLVFHLLEKIRMETTGYIDADSPIAIKKGAGGRRSLGFMTLTFNILNDIYNPSFWNSLEIMIDNGVLTRTEKKHIEYFFVKLIQLNPEHRRLNKLLKINNEIIKKYTNEYFLKKLDRIYGIKLYLNDTEVINMGTRGYIADLINAFCSSDSSQLAKISNAYKNSRDAIKKHVIFYYLALNNNLPLEISKFIARNFANERALNNVRRNLMENALTDSNKELLFLLSKDPDPKVRYYARIKLGKKDILLSKLIRYPLGS